MDKSLLNCSLNNNLTLTDGFSGDINIAGTSDCFYYDSGTTGWQIWRDWYYPQVIRESYPVYIQEKALDKGKQAFEIIKILKDKKLVNINKVGDFVDLMDELIKIL